MSILLDALNWVKNHGEMQQVERDGKLYTSRQAHWIDTRDPIYLPDAIEFDRLAGFASYIKNRDTAKDDAVFIVVHSPFSVCAYKPFDPADRKNGRVVVAQADFQTDSRNVQTSQWTGQEQFIIWLATQFVKSPERDRLVKIASSVTAEVTATAEDDGVTQVTSTRVSAAGHQKEKIENPFTLSLYRTWPEVKQPESLYMLRKRVERGAVELSLFDVAGDTWKLPAIKNICDFLNDQNIGVPVYG